ncbi:Fic family protein [Phenylobacterium sp.]|uniref:Fic family protein n=1 Tax=Phenylobacterium sp. TaxID=1871053 RepID=UPI0025E135B2|nr:Fic family protein [Phenylobacterium sp.]
MIARYLQWLLMTKQSGILLSNALAATRIAPNRVDGKVAAHMSAKPYDLSEAVYYHTGAFPPASLDYESLLGPLEEAAASLARYDAKMSSMVNSELFVAPLRRQDAVSSSRMEGTISTIEELYRLEAEEDAGATDPYREARNDDIETFLYSRALRNAQQALADGAPLSEHLIRTAHQQLLSFGRGARKRPGAYKVEQNYIGDDRRGKIHYVPIAPEHLAPAMAELIQFMNESTMRPLLRTALTHVEFEALHPFEDGNGRIGRMLITLMLCKLGIISQPNFFVSGYFETHKDQYVERMRAVSAEGDWSGWSVFFLQAMHAQATVNIQTADKISSLHNEMRERFREALNSQFHDRALDFVFARPVFRNDIFVDRSGIPASSARSLSRRLVEVGLLRTIEPAAGRRAALYSFDPLLDILKV